MFTRFIILLIIVIASNTVCAQKLLNVPKSFVQEESSHGGDGRFTRIQADIDIGVWSGQQVLTVISTFTDSSAKGGSACDDAGDVDYINTEGRRDISSMTRAQIAFSTCLNKVDKLDRNYTMTLSCPDTP